METCQALLLWGSYELANMRQRRACSIWGLVDILLKERSRRFYEKIAHSKDASAFYERIDPRELVEQELTINALWVMGKQCL